MNNKKWKLSCIILLLSLIMSCNNESFSYLIFYDGEVASIPVPYNSFKEEKFRLNISTPQGQKLCSGMIQSGFNSGKWIYHQAQISLFWRRFSTDVVDVNVSNDWHINKDSNYDLECVIPVDNQFNTLSYLTLMEVGQATNSGFIDYYEFMLDKIKSEYGLIPQVEYSIFEGDRLHAMLVFSRISDSSKKEPRSCGTAVFALDGLVYDLTLSLKDLQGESQMELIKLLLPEVLRSIRVKKKFIIGFDNNFEVVKGGSLF